MAFLSVSLSAAETLLNAGLAVEWFGAALGAYTGVFVCVHET